MKLQDCNADVSIIGTRDSVNAIFKFWVFIWEHWRSKDTIWSSQVIATFAYNNSSIIPFSILN